jgi:hypothetical protein
MEGRGRVNIGKREREWRERGEGTKGKGRENGGKGERDEG